MRPSEQHAKKDSAFIDIFKIMLLFRTQSNFAGGQAPLPLPQHAFIYAFIGLFVSRFIESPCVHEMNS